MRAPLATIAVLASLTALAPTGTVAHAGAAEDWRAAACREDDGDLAVGTYTVTRTLSQRVERIPSLTLTAERLVFAGGARCDLISLDGRLPVGRELTGYGSETVVLGELVVGGASQGEMALITAVSGVGGTAPITPARHLVVDAQVFPEVESGTMPDSPHVQEAWRNQPYSSTHTRTTFTATVTGRAAQRKTFTVTRATRAAAERRLASALKRADTAAERRAARTTYRLALRGVRLVMRKVRHVWSAELR